MSKAAIAKVLAHWDALLENFRASPLEFYARVEEVIAARGIAGVKLSRVMWREGSRWSARREYLRVQRGELVFDICAAPSGSNFFVSWWLGQTPPSLLSETPLFGALAQFLRGETTYYEVDVQAMFQRAVHESVLAVVDELTMESDIPPLAEDERIPVLSEFFDQHDGESAHN